MPPVYQTSPQGSVALAAAISKSRGRLRPPEALSLSEWSDKYAYVPPEAGAFPGKFYTSSAEYQRGMQDAITDPSIETIVFMLPSQSGKTQIQLNAVGYFSHHEPSPILFVQASEGEAEKFSKNRVSKMIRSTPVLRKIFPSPRARDSGNTLLNKQFAGGVLILAGANAPAGLASMPIRILMPDEVDRYPESAGTEGDPVDLAMRRTTTFYNRKHILASTPGIKGISRIEKAYVESDQRKYYVPCPHCQTMQPLLWSRLQWVKDDSGRVVDVFYACEEGCEIQERSKHEMIRRGEWRSTAASHDSKTAGFHLNALYPPWLRWGDIVTEWLSAEGSLERRKTFINTRLAETWEIKGTGADLHELEKRKAPVSFGELLPAGVLFLTAGVDVQDNRLEAAIYGWGMSDERWVIDHRVFPGDPALPESNTDSPWAAVKAFLLESYDHELGASMTAAAACFDSAGHHTQRVYEFTKKYEARRWFAIVGRSGIGKALVSRGSEQGPQKVKLFTVGVDTAKEDIYTSFNVKAPGPGYCHFSSSLQPEYFRQVTSEQLVKTKKDFITTLRWVKKGDRNEALDCFVYARAAVAILRPRFSRIQKDLQHAAERLAAESAEAPVEESPETQESPKPQAASPKKAVLPDKRVQQLAKAFSGKVRTLKRP